MTVLIEAAGYIAGCASITALAMRTMLPLRSLMVCSSVLFIAYAFYHSIYPTLFVHSILLPFNLYRLVELLRLNKAAMEARRSPTADFKLFKFAGKKQSIADGTYLFRKGDAPDYVYYIEEGEIALEELGITLKAGDVLGEMAFFTDHETRSASARSNGPVVVRRMDDDAFMKLYFQSPAFALAIQKLITRRLLEKQAL